MSGYKTRIASARQLLDDSRRWQIVLECGHIAIVTSIAKPVQAFCRECSKAKPGAQA